MDFQRDVLTEEAILNIYNGIEQDIPENVYYHSIYTEIVLKMILEIRDIQNGSEHEERAYKLLQKWITSCPIQLQQTAEDQALKVLERMCIQYGCWKDIKNLCLLLANNEKHLFFIKRSLQMMNDHLYLQKTNVAKWIPRVGSSPLIQGFSIYDYLATDYVERYLEIETAVSTSSLKQIHQLYKSVVKKQLNNQKNFYPNTTTTKQKTKKTYQEAETALIKKSLLLAQKPISTETMNEEDRIEQEWLEYLSSYETIDNAIIILDTPVDFKDTTENINRIKMICRFLYKINLPSRKRILITTAPEPVWFNFIGKTLVDTIRAIIQYTEVNDNPTEKSRTNSILYLLNSLKNSEIKINEIEKMSWIIISEFSDQPFSITHGLMTQLFLSYSVIPQFIPNLIYIKTPSIKNTQNNKEEIVDPKNQPFRCFIPIRTFWTECSSKTGISNNHWKQISKISKDPYIRQFTPFQNIVNIVSTYTPVF